MIPSIDDLRAAGVLNDLDVQVTRSLSRLSGERRHEVLLALALASRAVGEGHTCVELPRLVQRPFAGLTDAIPTGVAWQWPGINEWLGVLQTSELVGDAAHVAPLCLEANGRLYLRRYWEHETSLVAELRRRSVTPMEIDTAWARQSLDRYFGHSVGEPDWQKVGAAVALRRQLCVISGGPGTGKTFTVVKLLALLIEAAQQAAQPLPRFVLVAPTGKAAARLNESIATAKASLACDETVRGAIGNDAAMTIHRCLAPIGSSETLFRHNRGNKLLAELVLVDEASMVDLALMARLFEAIPADARVILLGDRDQLASVEAGAVFGDICNSGAAVRFSAPMAGWLESVCGTPIDAAEGETPPIADCVVQLEKSFRYKADSGVAAMASAIRASDVGALRSAINGAADVERLEPPTDAALHKSIHDELRRLFREMLRLDDVERLRRFDTFRVLCAHRRGDYSVETANLEIERDLRDSRIIGRLAAAYDGRPVMVMRNDYTVKLFNGDVGIFGRDRAAESEALMVAFAAGEGAVRRLAPSRLPPHETVFAMSVHKSQGSEFDQVAVVLPTRQSPILTRELLYTAVTRARSRVVLQATVESLEAAIRTPIERASGLRDRLWGG